MISKLALFADYYEFIMAYGYFKQNIHEKIVYFDVFYRANPDDASFSIFAGLEELILHIKNFSFSKEDIEYLRALASFDEDFLSYLSKLRFSGDLFAFKEGSISFANEPVLVLKAPLIEAQLLETFILAAINYQSLIATKASRIVRAAAPKSVIEYGARRAHGVEAAIKGARAAYIGGVKASSNTKACELYGIDTSGTMAHSWVLMFDDELQAFNAYAKLYKDNLILLIDTYDALNSGIMNAIKSFKAIKAKEKMKHFGVRLDSGNLCEDSIKIRKILDENDLKTCKIYVSGSLDEQAILCLEKNGAKIDAYGVGEKLITSASSPVFGAVYKLCALEDEKGFHPKMKLSLFKANLPHFKKVLRFYKGKRAIYDKLYIHDEKVEEQNYKELLIKIFEKGRLIYKLPSLEEIKIFCKNELESLGSEQRAINNPKAYELKLSKKLQILKEELSK